MKKIFTLCFSLLLAGVMVAQEAAEKPWKFNGSLGANAAATGLWNWTAGGNNNINGVVYGRFRLLYEKDNFSWDNNLDMEYGLSWIDQEFDKLQKSSDKFNFSTKFGWQFSKAWLLTGQVGFNTQFSNGRNYDGTGAYDAIISRGLAPAYLDLSLGIDWKPNDIFSVYLSPVAGRITTVYLPAKVVEAEREKMGHHYNAEETLKESYAVWKYVSNGGDAFTKDYSKNVNAELGLTLKGNINYTYKDLKLQTALTLFTPYKWDRVALFQEFKDGVETGLFYEQSAKPAAQDGYTYVDAGFRDNNRRFGHFDVDWTTALSYQFLKCLQVTFSTDLRYYNGVKIADKEGNNPKERVQFKGIIGVGVGYSF